MNRDKYISQIQAIRTEISQLTDLLWKDFENQEVFGSKEILQNQIIHDIIYGYEEEVIEEE